MATIKTISATYGRKVNLGDYNSAHIEMTVWAELDEGDNEAKVGEGLRQMARNHVMVEMARVVPSLSAKVQDIFMGLPAQVRKQVLVQYEDEEDENSDRLAAWDNGGHPMNFGDK